jgi:ribosome biogenesis protein NSA1
VADAVGQIAVFDVQSGQMVGAIKGPTGSVRSLVLHPAEPFLASVGLDRFLRVHHTASRKQLGEVYLKQHLTGVAFISVPVTKDADPDVQANEALEGEKREKKKKKRQKVAGHE